MVLVLCQNSSCVLMFIHFLVISSKFVSVCDEMYKYSIHVFMLPMWMNIVELLCTSYALYIAHLEYSVQRAISFFNFPNYITF